MIPHLFRPHPLPEELPEELQKDILHLSNEASSDEDFVKKCFFRVVSFQNGHRINLLLRFSRLFWTNIQKLSSFRGYFHCTTANYLLRVMLVKSGRVPTTNIRQVPTVTWGIFPHQYLQVRLEKKTLSLDPWAYRFEIEFGDYSHGFHAGKIFPIR